MLVRKLVITGFVSFLATIQVGADVIQPNTHTVARCATIGNLDDFPDIAVVGAFTNTSCVIADRYLVKSDSCLRQGYRFGSFCLVWVAKPYLETQGLANLPIAELLPSISAKKRVVAGVAAQMGLIPIEGTIFSSAVPDSNPIVKEKLVFSLTMNSASGFGTYLAEKVTTDKAGVEIGATYNPIVHVERNMDRQLATAMVLNPRLCSGRLIITPDFNGKMSGELFDCRGRTASSFEREVRPGATYLIPCSGAASGIYWLRVTNGTTTANVRLSALE